MTKARAILFLIFSLLIVSCDRLVEKEVVVFVASQTAPCGDRTCLQISEVQNGPFFLNTITGFTHVAGFRYKLRIQASTPNADTVGSFSVLKLLETLEKTPAQ
jgi:Domain of unknown function (DUF4377)